MAVDISNHLFISLMIQNKIFLTIDFFFASKFCKTKDENELLALAFLFAAARKGHLCVKIDGKNIKPSPKSLFFENEELLNSFTQKLLDGYSLLAEEYQIDEKDIPFSFEKEQPIFYWKNSFYLQRNFIFEEEIFQFFKIHYNSLPSLEIASSEIDHLLTKYRDKLSLEQSLAIKKALTNSISFIFGGPGTGKTYVAKILIEIFALLTQKAVKIIVTAPTGKAAMNLETKVQNEGLSFSVRSSTLHALLKINSQTETFYIDADLIIVDEASMIDAKIMSRFFKAIKEGNRIVIIGDPYQLPSVESGNLFSIFEKLKISKNSQVLSCCRRNNNLQLQAMAEAIKNGHSEVALSLLKKGDLSFSYKEQGQENLILQDVFSFTEKNYLELSCEKKSPENLLNDFSRNKILTPLKEGLLGVDHLNALIFEYIKSKGSSLFSYPILITKNDYRLNLYNGSLGIVVKEKKNISLEENAYFFEEGKLRKIPLFMISSYELSFVLTVHKSQGSEFDKVLLILSEGSTLFGRELLYTAVTRTKNNLTIISKDSTIAQIIRNKSEIESNLFEKIASIS